MISVNVEELRNLGASIDTGTGRVGKNLSTITRKHGEELLTQTKANSPVRSGELKGSWQLTTMGDGRSSAMSAAVQSTVRQAFFQEYGTSRHAAQPSAGPALESVAPGYLADLEAAAGEVLN